MRSFSLLTFGVLGAVEVHPVHGIARETTSEEALVSVGLDKVAFKFPVAGGGAEVIKVLCIELEDSGLIGGGAGVGQVNRDITAGIDGYAGKLQESNNICRESQQRFWLISMVNITRIHIQTNLTCPNLHRLDLGAPADVLQEGS